MNLNLYLYPHSLFVSKVPVLRDVLCADHQGIGGGVQLQHLLGQVNANGAGATAHARQIVADDVGAQLEVVDHPAIVWGDRAQC